MKKFLLLLVFMGAFIVAQAQDRFLAYEGDDFSIYFYPPKKSSGGYKVWVAWEFDKPQTVGSIKYYTIKTYSEYDRDFEKKKNFTIIYYDKNGKVLDSVDDSYPSWNYIVPETVGEDIAEAIASYISHNNL